MADKLVEENQLASMADKLKERAIVKYLGPLAKHQQFLRSTKLVVYMAFDKNDLTRTKGTTTNCELYIYSHLSLSFSTPLMGPNSALFAEISEDNKVCITILALFHVIIVKRLMFIGM